MEYPTKTPMTGNSNFMEVPPPYQPTRPANQPIPHPPHQIPTGNVSTHIIRTEVVHEPTSCMTCTVPSLPKGLALTFCIMNCIIPGWGAIASAFFSCCYKQHPEDEAPPCAKCNSCCGTFSFGLLQFLTTPCFLIGWIWSVLWGLQLLRSSERNISKTTTISTTEITAGSGSYVSAFPTSNLTENELPSNVEIRN